jgi:hypothetical protein
MVCLGKGFHSIGFAGHEMGYIQRWDPVELCGTRSQPLLQSRRDHVAQSAMPRFEYAQRANSTYSVQR